MLTHPTSTSRNVTGVIAIHTAGSIDVCREGGKVAMHINTPGGVVLVHISESVFVRSCRGRCDANGNPFRTLDEVDYTKRREMEEATVPPPAPAKPRTFTPRAPRPKTDEQLRRIRMYRQIFAVDQTRPARGTIASLCRQYDVPQVSYYSWRQAELKQLAEQSAAKS